MTLIAIETKGSGTASTALSISGVETTTATRTFLVYDDAGNSTSISGAVADSSLPQIGDSHGSIPDLRVTRRDIKRTAERNDAWKVTYSYEFLLEQPEIVVSQSGDISAQFVDMWRGGASQPSPLGSPSRDDIFGTPIDIGGKPVSVLVRQQTFSTTFETSSVPVGLLSAATGSRNSGWWFGFRQGHLVYQGVSFSTKTPSSYTRTDKFLYDGFGHARQKPFELDGDLTPILDTDGHVEKIRWVQPYPRESNFGGLGIPLG